MAAIRHSGRLILARVRFEPTPLDTVQDSTFITALRVGMKTYEHMQATRELGSMQSVYCEDIAVNKEHSMVTCGLSLWTLRIYPLSTQYHTLGARQPTRILSASVADNYMFQIHYTHSWILPLGKDREHGGGLILFVLTKTMTTKRVFKSH
jgi:hypothetical protein